MTTHKQKHKKNKYTKLLIYREIVVADLKGEHTPLVKEFAHLLDKPCFANWLNASNVDDWIGMSLVCEQFNHHVKIFHVAEVVVIFTFHTSKHSLLQRAIQILDWF